MLEVKSVRVLMVTPEATPFAHTGGLGEVLSALPGELAGLGIEIDVLMPKYRGITPEKLDIRKIGPDITVTLNDRDKPGRFWEHNDPRGCRFLFLENEEYYDREGLYGTPKGDFDDNAERFVFLARAAIEMCIASGITYDVFHSHDWQSALTSVYLRTLFAGEPSLDSAAAVLTIHNLGYQGIFWHWDMPLVGVGWEYFNPRQMEYYGNLNFLKSGIVFSDKVNTVSPGYRNEILTEEFGWGLQGVLTEKGPDLVGILNGVDYSVWNPEADTVIPCQYSADDPTGKQECKALLQKRAELPIRAAAPLIGMVTRLSSQKGIDLLEDVIPTLAEHDVQLVILGSGEKRYEDACRLLAKEHPSHVALFLAFDQELAHTIFAGSDMILIPSRYEPCGLAQMYGLRYGAVPIVRATGGLQDTVIPYDHYAGSGTGFTFETASSDELEETVMEAVRVFRGDPDAWRQLMARGMRQDFSWERSAVQYKELYEQALAMRRDR
jgi:starch synthase